MPAYFKPSAWMFTQPYDPRIHSCYTFWLASNYRWPIAKWTRYRCPHYDEHGDPYAQAPR
jgi:hypothetical protein